MSAPVFEVTHATPNKELEEFVSADEGSPSSVTHQPSATQEPSLDPKDLNTLEDGRSSFTISEAGSGYQRDTNECTEFCLEFFTCFGLCDACCPSNGEGCVTSVATFCGNLFFSCCKC